MITTNNRTETINLLNSSCGELIEKPSSIYQVEKGILYLTKGNMTVSIKYPFKVENWHL